MGTSGEIRKLLQGLLAPELRDLRAEVSGVKAELPQKERRLLEAIRSSEEKLSLKIENAELRAQITDLRRKHEQESAPQ